jgi:hypothetical protein
LVSKIALAKPHSVAFKKSGDDSRMNRSRGRQQASLLLLALILIGITAFRVANYSEIKEQLALPQGVLWPDKIHTLPGFKIRLLHVAHLTPHGASYDATMETVLRARALPLTAMQFGSDGALYFITGGRGAQSVLYRLSYDGLEPATPQKTDKELAVENDAAAARQLRHELESYQGHRDLDSVNKIFPALRSEDRWIRNAARVALEAQDVASWRDLALAETDVDGGLTALMALARSDAPTNQPQLLTALEKFPFDRLTTEQTLFKLRVMELSFIRQGRPTADSTARTIT